MRLHDGTSWSHKTSSTRPTLAPHWTFWTGLEQEKEKEEEERQHPGERYVEETIEEKTESNIFTSWIEKKEKPYKFYL